jgi:serine/threonine protein kinase
MLDGHVMHPEHAHEWSPPTAFDGFELRGLLGQGGMGRVYLAHEVMLDRQVAIKFILGSIQGRARERFLMEARAVARLAHANIVAIHRLGEVQGRPYVAYEYIEGRNLEEHPRPAAWSDVLRIGLGVSRALAAAHARGVLHRDVKPANILETATGELKLVDFGLAKLHPLTDGPLVALPSTPPAPLALSDGDENDHDAHAQTQPLAVRSDASQMIRALAAGLPASNTATGVLVGTPLFLAPEVWLGEAATPASDVFALGLVLYELATGAIPHADSSPREIARAIVSGALPGIAQVRPDFPLAVSRLIERAIERRPEARFKSGAELLEGFESLDKVLSGFRTLSPARGESVDSAALVSASLARLGPHVDEVYQSVYALLFQKQPDLRGLFPEDLTAQRAKLAAALQLVVENLRCPEHVVTALEELGHRHVGYGARAEHLASLGDALLTSLELHDPMVWDDATRQAWQDAYRAISAAMRRGLSSGTLTKPDVRA